MAEDVDTASPAQENSSHIHSSEGSELFVPPLQLSWLRHAILPLQSALVTSLRSTRAIYL